MIRKKRKLTAIHDGPPEHENPSGKGNSSPSNECKGFFPPSC